MAPLEFDTAIKRVSLPDEEPEVEYAPHVLKINERDPDTDEVVNTVELHAYDPDEAAVAIFMADMAGRRSTTTDKVSGTIDFFLESLEPDSRAYVTERLLDRQDPFSLDNVVELAYGLIELWSGRPTKQPSDFRGSRKNGGQRSTRPTKKTSSASRSTGT